MQQALLHIEECFLSMLHSVKIIYLVIMHCFLRGCCQVYKTNESKNYFFNNTEIIFPYVSCITITENLFIFCLQLHSGSTRICCQQNYFFKFNFVNKHSENMQYSKTSLFSYVFCLGNIHFSMLLTKFILNNFQYFAFPLQGASQLHF